ncbi:hypothetical protein PAP_09185 [Palaeococcus pacificus DY20341]|uniref:Uncharacterized protein n=1 Tax=Palaeococcus pacificus DY20341 TaxID=1343739 RepID=A0A075LU21_9EURY|nr:hypothetical protein [Palaeococcus pacificus]AIF70215.1 hypothetical protein PAP_09185 [Palaeococcus pacificus DY20341]
MTNRPRYTIRIYMGSKDKYIALSLWEAHIDNYGNFRPANVSMVIHNEDVEAKASLRTETAARLAAVLLNMVAEAEKLTMKERKKFAMEEKLEEQFLLEEEEEEIMDEVEEIEASVER